jgi:hypothetical protein
MKIKSIAAVGAMGVGLGIASFIGGTGTASAACDDTQIPIGERANCLVSQDISGFLQSTDPFTAVNTFIEGSPDDTDFGSLGVAHWGDTFKNSVADFANGPRSSIEPPSSDDGDS